MDRDSDLSIKELMEQEKMTTAEEQIAMFGAMSSKVNFLLIIIVCSKNFFLFVKF